MQNNYQSASFRDPAGFLFWNQGVLYRQINKIVKNDFDKLISSGLYEKLVKSKLLIPHKEVKLNLAQTEDAFRIIKPEIIPFISYPYEWSFSQLKDAALLTLQIQKMALEYGLSLKDASAYNVQFIGSRPIFIDTLSFEHYKEGSPWIAYRQFCQHFLAPLALCSYTDLRLNQLMRLFIDGIPLDLAAKLLPLKTLFNPMLLMHLHLHAKSQKHFADNKVVVKDKGIKISPAGYRALIKNLLTAVSSLKIKNKITEWSNYYQFTNYTTNAFNNKKKVVSEYLASVKPKKVWDFGANIGEFSALAASSGAYTVAWDIDHLAVEKHFLNLKQSGSKNILPLIIDLTMPSANKGWHLRERLSLLDRGPVDLVLALALIHHLAISNNVPLSSIAAFFADTAFHAIVEFIPNEDSQVQKLLKNREDVFSSYTMENFEKAMLKYFKLIKKTKIKDSKRTLYLYSKK